jgi:Arc/MetJ-type ribon-helix-helix transcriptional regulator
LSKKTVWIPEKMFNEVSRLVKQKGMWANEAEFVREAVREKIQGTKRRG